MKKLGIVLSCSFISIVFFFFSNFSFAAQNSPLKISGRVYFDPYHNGTFIPGNGIGQSQLLVSGDKFQKKITTNKDGKYSIDIPQSGFYTIQLLNTSPSYKISSKRILVEKKFPLVTVNFTIPLFTPAPNNSFNVQNAGYPDCEEPTGCNAVNKLCGDDGVSILQICFDAAHDNQLCTKPTGAICNFGLGLVCSNGACKCPTGTIWDPATGSCVDEQPSCDPNTCVGCNQALCTSTNKCRWNGYSCQVRCGGPSELCCAESSCGPNLQCNSINRCEPCGLQGQKCCSSSPSCGTGLTCGTGNTCAVKVNYKVNGIIFLDTNNNGIRDNQETLFTQPATVTAGAGGSTTTSNGVYEIVLANSGSYQIKLENLPSGYSPAYNPTPGIAVDQYSPTATVNLGVIPKLDYKIQGTVFIDTNKNGQKDANEVGSGNEYVSFASGNQTETALTSTNGSYSRTLQKPGYYTATLLTKPDYDNTSPEIVNFYIDASNPTKTIDFGIYPKGNSTPIVKFTKPASDGLTVSGIIDIQATASVSGSTFTSFKICSDEPGDCLPANSADLANQSNITINVPGGVDTKGLPNGNHTLTATAVAANGKTGEAKRTIKVQNNTPTPTKTSTPTPTPTITPIKTPTPTTNPVGSATPVPSSKLVSPTPINSPSPITTSPTVTPTPGTCNNNNFCEFGENVNTCPADCQIRCGDNICSQPQENQFSCSADCHGEGLSGTPSPTRSSTNTPTPTRNPSDSATPTPLPGTPTVTPTNVPGQASLSLRIKLPGIGNASGDNGSPVTPTRQVDVQLINSANQIVKTTSGNLQYDPALGLYTGQFSIGSIPTGNYTVLVKMNNTLIKKFAQPVSISSEGATGLSQIELVSGDFDGTNQLDLLDYNQLLACYNKNATVISGCQLQDLNDDGKVEEKDVNIFLRGFAIKDGDKP